MAKAKRAALYLRVSTDGQTTENQRMALERLCEQRGWEVVEIYADNGISGSKGRKDRPRLDAMLREASRRRFDVVVTWAIDRLGRSMTDLLNTLETLHAAKVDLVMHEQNIDTTTPTGELIFHVMGAFAQFERKMIQSRINAGLVRARAKGSVFGRPKTSKEDEIRVLLASGTMGMLKIAARVGVGSGTVQRVKAEMQAARGSA